MNKRKNHVGARKPLIFQPPVPLLVKLGSIVVHCEEMLGPDAQNVDRIAAQGLLNDPTVRQWLSEMTEVGLLPVRRTAADVAARAQGRK